MKRNPIYFGLLLMFSLISIFSVNAQKKVHNFTISRIIQAPAEKVWAIVGEDYGAIANSHPKVIRSNYINGSLKSGEGAERVCFFNDKGTRFVKEKQMNYDPANYTFKNQMFQAGKFPVDENYTYAVYQIEALDANTSKFTFTMNYRTKPAFMGGFAKGSFKKLIRNYAIAVEHHVRTGEKVTKENFKDIKREYKVSR